MMKRKAVRLALMTSWREDTHGKDDFGCGNVRYKFGGSAYSSNSEEIPTYSLRLFLAAGMAFWLPRIRGQGMAAKGPDVTPPRRSRTSLL